MLAAALHDPVGALLMWRDVVVVGAGPAGALAAREVARSGASVLLMDRSDFPRWKVCGACLSGGALELLESVGLGHLPAALGGVSLNRFVVSAGRRTTRLRLGRAVAVSRPALDGALVEAAEATGVEFWSAAKATGAPLAGDSRVVAVERRGVTTEVRARVVLDATGLGSGLAVPGCGRPRVATGSRVGLGATFDDTSYPVAPGDLHMVVGRAGYVGLVRVESGALNVAAAVDPRALRSADAEGVVADILSSAGYEPLSQGWLAGWRGTPALTRSPTEVGAERLLRLGDAAGYVEPFTGEGMAWALGAGRAVAPLAVAGARRWEPELLAAWNDFQRAAAGGGKRLCRVLAPSLRRTWLVEWTVAVLSLAPGLAAPFVRHASRVPTAATAYCP